MPNITTNHAITYTNFGLCAFAKNKNAAIFTDYAISDRSDLQTIDLLY